MGQWLADPPGEWCYIRGFSIGLNFWQVEYFSGSRGQINGGVEKFMKLSPLIASIFATITIFHKGLLSKLWAVWANKWIDIQNDLFWPPDYWEPPLWHMHIFLIRRVYYERFLYMPFPDLIVTNFPIQCFPYSLPIFQTIGSQCRFVLLAISQSRLYFKVWPVGRISHQWCHQTVTGQQSISSFSRILWN